MVDTQPRVNIRRIETPCANCPLRSLKSFRQFSAEELKFVEKFKVAEARFSPNQTILAEGDDPTYLYTVLSGWVMKYKMLEDGRRQIINYALPGDLVGLQAAVLGKMQHSVEALSDVTLCALDKKKIWKLYADHQGLAFDITWLAAEEKTILADYLVSAGQRTANERIAFLLLTLFDRARNRGLVRKSSLQLPVSQQHLADTIGFSLVHTNKRLNRLRSIGAFNWTAEQFTMLNEAMLAEIAGWTDTISGRRPFI